jgi:hypothetical protein
VRYELEEVGAPTLEQLLEPLIAQARSERQPEEARA